jgi:hypothetical protein
MNVMLMMLIFVPNNVVLVVTVVGHGDDHGWNLVHGKVSVSVVVLGMEVVVR